MSKINDEYYNQLGQFLFRVSEELKLDPNKKYKFSVDFLPNKKDSMVIDKISIHEIINKGEKHG